MATAESPLAAAVKTFGGNLKTELAVVATFCLVVLVEFFKGSDAVIQSSFLFRHTAAEKDIPLCLVCRSLSLGEETEAYVLESTHIGGTQALVAKGGVILHLERINPIWDGCIAHHGAFTRRTARWLQSIADAVAGLVI